MAGPVPGYTARMVRDFFAEQDLSFAHIEVLTHAMVALARVDGIHDSEMALIRDMYASCARAGDPRLEDVAKGELDLERAKTLFDTPELSKLFVKCLILLAFADGTYAAEEDALIRTWAEGLSLSSAEVDGLHEATKEFLLGSLAHVKNTEALVAVMAKLDLPISG